MEKGRKMQDACTLCGGRCWSCTYADECNQWLDIAPYDVAQIPADSAFMALCEGRHEIPQAEDGSIFGNSINPLDVAGLETEAAAKLEGMGIQSLDLYVTGLSVALLAVVNACHKLGIALTCWHFDRESGTYYPQRVAWQGRRIRDGGYDHEQSGYCIFGKVRKKRKIGNGL